VQWVFNNPACNGFLRFPTLGLQALKYSWNFDFQVRRAVLADCAWVWTGRLLVHLEPVGRPLGLTLLQCSNLSGQQ
jgi:hypothetical protein